MEPAEFTESLIPRHMFCSSPSMFPNYFEGTENSSLVFLSSVSSECKATDFVRH